MHSVQHEFCLNQLKNGYTVISQSTALCPPISTINFDCYRGQRCLLLYHCFCNFCSYATERLSGCLMYSDFASGFEYGACSMMLNSSIIFSCGHVTLHLAMSVRKKVTFLNCKRFLHNCSCPSVCDWIAVYLALFPSNLQASSCNCRSFCQTPTSVVFKKMCLMKITL